MPEEKEKKKVYEIEEMTLGLLQSQSGKIVFKTIGDMEQAYQDIDNGKDIYVKQKDGVITKLLNQMITSTIYEGKLVLAARGVD